MPEFVSVTYTETLTKTCIVRPLVNMLQMLSLYIYTLIIEHKSCNVLSILNKLTLQKTIQNFVKTNAVLDKKVKHNNNKTKDQA